MLASLPTGEEARNYIVEHKVLSVVQQGLERLLSERPADPTSHLAGFLQENNLLKKKVTTPFFLSGDVVTLVHHDASVHLRDTVLRSVKNWRHAGKRVWGCSLPGSDGWGRILDYVKQDYSGVQKLIVLLVDSQQVIYYKGLPHHPTDYPDTAAVPLREALRRSGKPTSDLASVVADAMQSKETRKFELETHTIAFDDTTVAPELSALDAITRVIDANREGLLEPHSTGIIVTSLTGKDDVTVAMSYIYSALHALDSLRRVAAEKQAWAERLAERSLRRSQVRSAIAELHRQGVEKDDRKIANLEVSAKNRRGEECEAEAKAREDKIASIRAARAQQWDKFELHLQTESCTKIAAVYRGFADRKRVKTIREGVRGGLQAPTPHATQSPPPGDAGKDARGPPPASAKKPKKDRKARHDKAQKKDRAKAQPDAGSPVERLELLQGTHLIQRCIHWFEATYGNQVVTRRDVPRERRVVTRSELQPNKYKRFSDGDFDYDDTAEDLFVMETVSQLEDEVATDFAVPIASYLTVLTTNCAQLRSVDADLIAAGRRYAGVPAIQARVLRTLHMMAYGICYSMYITLREGEVHGNSLGDGGALFQLKPGAPRVEGRPFSDWMQRGCALYEVLRHAALVTGSPPAVPTHDWLLGRLRRGGVCPLLRHRRLVHSEPLRATHRNSLGGGTQRGCLLSHTHAGAQDPHHHHHHHHKKSLRDALHPDMREGSPPGRGAVHRRFSRRLQLFSAPDVVDPSDAREIFAGVSPHTKLMLWLTLTPDLTLVVRPVGAVVARLPLAREGPSQDAMRAVVGLCKLETLLESKEREKERKDKKERKRRQSVQSSSQRSSRGARSARPDAGGQGWAASPEKEKSCDAVAAVPDAAPSMDMSLTADLGDRTRYTSQVSHVAQHASEPASPPDSPHASDADPLAAAARGCDTMLGYSVSALEDALATEVQERITATGSLDYTSVTDGKEKACVYQAGPSDGVWGQEQEVPAGPPVHMYADVMQELASELPLPCPLVHMRQALLPGVSDELLQGLGAVARVIEEAVQRVVSEGDAFHLGDVCVCVAHDELGPMFLVAAAAAFAASAQKLAETDLLATLQAARAESNARPATPPQANADEPVSAASSPVPFQEAPSQESASDDGTMSSSQTQTDDSAVTDQSTESDRLTLTQRLMSVHALDVASETSLDHPEPLLSPFPCINDLVQSPLGAAMGLCDALGFLEQLFACGSKHLEEHIVGGMASAFEALADTETLEQLGARARSGVAQKGARDTESYALLLFFCSWLLATLRRARYGEGVSHADPQETRPAPTSALQPSQDDELKPRTDGTFLQWMTQTHPGATVWLMEVNPWCNQVCICWPDALRCPAQPCGLVPT